MGRSKVHTQLGPCIKVILGSDGTTNTAIPTNRPVLLESGSALDRRLVGAGGLEDVVGTAVRLDGAFLGRCGAGIVRAVGLDDVVFDQGVLGPAVDAEVAVSIDVVAAGVLDGSILLVSDVYAIDGGRMYWALPGFQPFPATKLPTLFQSTVYSPPGPLL